MNPPIQSTTQAAVLQASYYWTAQQLHAMQGLNIEPWYRQTVAVSDMPEALHAPEPSSPEASKTVDSRAHFQAQTPVNADARAEAAKAKSVDASNLSVAAIAAGEWMAISAKPLSAQAQVLWSNMLASIGQSIDAGQVFALQGNPLARADKQPEALSDAVQSAVSALSQQARDQQVKRIFALGEFAAQATLGIDEPFVELSTDLHDMDGIPMLVLHDPDELLQSPQLKAQAWQLLSHALSS